MVKYVCLMICFLVCFAPQGRAEEISFSVSEGYANGAVNGQPGPGGWSATTYHFKVCQTFAAPHQDLLWIELGTEHGSSSETVTAQYATKRMVPVTGQFSAAFTFKMNGQTHLYDQSAIALGQAADTGWGPYFGLNKTSDASLAVREGTGWIELVTGLESSKWYDVMISGDVATGQFDVAVYDEAVHNADPDLGLLYDDTHSFQETPTELAYVMITNEGAGKDTGAYGHLYDDLVLVPEPATLGLLSLGGLAAVRRRRRG